MRTRIISLLLSFAFLSMISIEYISATAVLENTSSKTVESVMEKRLAEKFVADENLLTVHLTLCKTDTKILAPTYKEVFYFFTSNNTLFKPPINI